MWFVLLIHFASFCHKPNHSLQMFPVLMSPLAPFRIVGLAIMAGQILCPLLWVQNFSWRQSPKSQSFSNFWPNVCQPISKKQLRFWGGPFTLSILTWNTLAPVYFRVRQITWSRNGRPDWNYISLELESGWGIYDDWCYFSETNCILLIPVVQSFGLGKQRIWLE